jgi:hypothetical protein
MDTVGLARVVVAGVLVASSCAMGPMVWADPQGADLVVALWADRDDDDANGMADGEQLEIPQQARIDLSPVAASLAGARMGVVFGGARARVVTAAGRPLPWGGEVPSGAFWQGLSPGRVEVTANTRDRGVVRVILNVSAIDMRDGEGTRVDMATSHASLERTPPIRIEGAVDAPYDDFDALRVVVSVPDDGLPDAPDLSVDSVGALGGRVDSMPRLALSPAPCAPDSGGLRCWASAPIRLVVDDQDRNQPLVKDRSIKATLGGAIVFRRGGRKAQMIRVLGPRSSPAGPIGLLRASLRSVVLRVTPGGAPAIGGDDPGAVNALRRELGAASAIWGQCGVTFGDPGSLEVRVMDPPPPHLVSIGDGLGIRASGGEIRLRVDGKPLAIVTRVGETPAAVALEMARVAGRAGLSCQVSSNATIAPGLGPSADVSFRRADRTLAAADRDPNAPLSTDPTLTVRIGSVDLSDGLEHFADMDSMAGTLEERTLLKAIDDGAPALIEVVVVPLFQGGGRIGESFIASDRSSLRNIVVLDRAGIRAQKSSLTLAHELGHVLMDLPGHPDDYGVDTPTLLMDSDAAEESPFGPRRISLDECARVLRESGPGSPAPLLVAVPIAPVPLRSASP